ncbi:hypothetical protein AQUCO_12000002v1 [Aquilegia coerulea]|uniref:KIB1-4 beta-propeller domain-containing protein n=1 Tax=Aquilegia coerulea TaxID=218851 RepID=A0A2G5C1X8_AQUCA|nr:hypothetical protein AQUCO_12000002v1 [Aquilegia coerulea]
MISRDIDTQIGSFYNLSDSKIYSFNLSKEASESFCCGSSSQGYLIMANRKGGNFLYNPFNQNTINLPQQFMPPKDIAKKWTKKDYPSYLRKAVICSQTPNKELYILALGSNARVIETCKPHDTEWSVFGADMEEDEDEYEDEEEIMNRYLRQQNNTIPDEVIQDDEENKWLFLDLLLYKGMLYGLTVATTLVCFELHDSSNPLGCKELNMLPKGRVIKRRIIYGDYLVESGEELLMVHRIRSFVNNGDGAKYTTIKFSVYRLHQTNDLFEWVEVQSLGNQMLFLGRNTSISVSTDDIPGLKGNCIYFIDDMWPYFAFGIDSVPSLLDNGVFYLDDGHIEKFYTPSDSDLIKSQPFWITPSAIQDVKL